LYVEEHPAIQAAVALVRHAGAGQDRVMGARSVVGSILLVIPLVVSCSTRSPERGPAATEDAAPVRDPATPGASTPAPAAGAEQPGPPPGPPVDITWRLVPTRMEGALELTDQNGGTRSEVFSASLPLGCERVQNARGALLAARCMGSLVGPNGAVQLTARRSPKELIISATGPLAGVAAGLPASKSGAEAKGTQILARIPRPPDTRTVRPRAGASDAARPGELLLDWSFATYDDVHVVIERPGASEDQTEAKPEDKPEAKPGTKIDRFVTELAGCDPTAPVPALPEGITVALACRHRGRTAILTARSQPGHVLVVHTVSGDGLERHQVDAQEIPLPALPVAETP
jgi:hypothetical protein